MNLELSSLVGQSVTVTVKEHDLVVYGELQQNGDVYFIDRRVLFLAEDVAEVKLGPVTGSIVLHSTVRVTRCSQCGGHYFGPIGSTPCCQASAEGVKPDNNGQRRTIGPQPAFAAGDCEYRQPGMNYRQWLVGQIAPAVVTRAFVEEWAKAGPEWRYGIASEVCRLADTIIQKLEDEP